MHGEDYSGDAIGNNEDSVGSRGDGDNDADALYMVHEQINTFKDAFPNTCIDQQHYVTPTALIG